MLEIVRLPLGALGTNCYLAARAGADEAAVIDPGDEPEVVLGELEARGWRAGGVLVTHGHYDHLGGVAGVARAAGVPVWMPRGEADELRRLAAAPYEPDHLLDGGETVAVAGIEFRAFPVPGHSPAALAYAADGALFAGDLLFAGSVGRTDLRGGDMGTLLASVRLLAESLAPETAVLPGHGPPTTLGGELATNPFLEPLRR